MTENLFPRTHHTMTISDMPILVRFLLRIWLRTNFIGWTFTKTLLSNDAFSPKSEELIASPYRHDGSKNKAAATFFEESD